MALGSNQSLTEMSTRNISWGVKAVRCVRITTWKSGSPNVLDASRPVQTYTGIIILNIKQSSNTAFSMYLITIDI